MKKIILPVLAVMTMGTASAQFNIGVSVGYGLGSPGHVLGTEDQTTGSVTTSSKNIYGTIGNGLQANLTPGYMFGEHFGMELGLNGFFGTATTVGKVNAPLGAETHTMKSNQFRIAPAFVIKSGGEKVSVYARTGLLIPLIGSVKSEIDDQRNPGVPRLTELKTTGKVTLGYTGAFGVNIHFGQKFGLFAEVGANSLRVKSKKTKMTKNMVGGTDFLDATPEFYKQTNYVDEINSSSNVSDLTKPADQLRQVANFSNFFVQVGFKITFTD